MSDNMTDKLQQEAREATNRHGIKNTDLKLRRDEAFYDGYLAAATAREKEIEELRARVAELEGMVPKWERSSDEAQRLLLIHGGWRVAIEVVQPETATLWKLYVPPSLTFPQISLPEGEVTK